MKTLPRFVAKFTSLIVAVLSCFDRVIFKGHLALAAPCELEYLVDCVLKVRRSAFMKTQRPGKGHGWPTMGEDLPLLADWFEKYLPAGK